MTTNLDGYPKKIAIVISGLTQGGAEYSICNLLPYIDETNIITIICLQNFDKEIELPRTRNYNLIRLEAKKLTDLSSFLRLKRILKNHEYIFAHLIWAQYWSGLMCVLDKSFREKTIWFEHNLYLDRKFLHWKILKFLGLFIKNVIAVSEEVSSYFTINTKIKTKVLPNPISVPKHLTGNARFEGKIVDIAVYGRLVNQKNPFLAADSFLELHRLKNIKYSPRLNIIGSGQLKAKLCDYCSTNPDIIFYEFPKKHLALQKLSECQIFLSTSRFEGFPLARFEALRLGLCVVSTKTAGLKFLLDYYRSEKYMREIGIYFVNEDLTEISQALKTLANKRFWRQDYIDQRVSCTKQLSPKNISVKLLQELE